MSYCVNCGVELEQTLKRCPLCNTPVYNPKEIQKVMEGNMQKAIPPFPQEKGQVEMVKRKDMAILLTTVVLSASFVCGLLNILVFEKLPWSLAIIGACVLLWVMLIPVAINTRQSDYTSILLDGIAVALYLYLMTFISGSYRWFFKLGLPIVLLITVVTELFVLCVKVLPRSFLTVALYAFSALAALCIGLETLIDRYLRKDVRLEWSAIILTVCILIDITIITILSRRRLRNEVRKRLHF